ncbi:hypothetical protein, partial [Salinivibrio sp. MA607]|uniref:hypothetical protein n=1 Tax=Salinivibrio sp. MA607 TaxID=1909457 RepID=UPI001A7E1A66
SKVKGFFNLIGKKNLKGILYPAPEVFNVFFEVDQCTVFYVIYAIKAQYVVRYLNLISIYSFYGRLSATATLQL